MSCIQQAFSFVFNRGMTFKRINLVFCVCFRDRIYSIVYSGLKLEIQQSQMFYKHVQSKNFLQTLLVE